MRELNEGVPRIYDEMKESSLDEPTFSETPGYFKLVLRNNIVARQLLQGKKIEADAGEQGLEQLDELERQILACLREKGMLSKSQLVMYIGKSSGTIKNRLRNLIKLKRIKANGNEHDPKRTYEIL